MIVWGGFGENGLALNTGGRYDPSTTLGQPPALVMHLKAETTTRRSGPVPK